MNDLKWVLFKTIDRITSSDLIHLYNELPQLRLYNGIEEELTEISNPYRIMSSLRSLTMLMNPDYDFHNDIGFSVKFSLMSFMNDLYRKMLIYYINIITTNFDIEIFKEIIPFINYIIVLDIIKNMLSNKAINNMINTQDTIINDIKTILSIINDEWFDEIYYISREGDTRYNIITNNIMDILEDELEKRLEL